LAFLFSFILTWLFVLFLIHFYNSKFVPEISLNVELVVMYYKVY
jgi:hypothetical protein